MLRLIKAELTTAGKPDLRYRAPSLSVNPRTLNALLCERGNFGIEVIAHQIKLVGAMRFCGVECGFGRWQREDQPAMACVDGFEVENVAEECTIRLGVLAIDDDVSAEIGRAHV